MYSHYDKDVVADFTALEVILREFANMMLVAYWLSGCYNEFLLIINNADATYSLECCIGVIFVVLDKVYKLGHFCFCA
jgi:hypothetical protein